MIIKLFGVVFVLLTLLIGVVVGIALLHLENKNRGDSSITSSRSSNDNNDVSLMMLQTDVTSPVPSSTSVPLFSNVPSTIPSDMVSTIPSSVPSDVFSTIPSTVPTRSPLPIISVPSNQPMVLTPFFQQFQPPTVKQPPSPTIAVPTTTPSNPPKSLPPFFQPFFPPVNAGVRTRRQQYS